ncbi:MAG: PAS domain-containing protein, partial [Rhodothermales bacterium]|nr:PAS domain-containing protein [Rhodothermales bacterium]
MADSPKHDTDAAPAKAGSVGVPPFPPVGDGRAAGDFAGVIGDAVREGLLVLDLDLRARAANAPFYRLFGVAPDETLGRLIYDIGDGQWDLPEIRGLLQRVLRGRGAVDGYEIEHDYERVGRRIVDQNARRSDTPPGILLTIEDATAQRASERDLRQSEGRFRTLFNETRDGILLADDTGAYIDANPAASALLGYERVGRVIVGLFVCLGDGVTQEEVFLRVLEE